MLSPREIDDIETETSNLILAAELGESPEIYKKAAMKELHASSVLEGMGMHRFINHLFSAGWCAFHARDKELAALILGKLDGIDGAGRSFSKEKKTLRSAVKRLK